MPKSDESVALKARAEAQRAVGTQFEDIFTVSGDCGDVKCELSDYSDEVDITGSMCRLVTKMSLLSLLLLLLLLLLLSSSAV